MTPATTTTDLILNADDMRARVVWVLDLPERSRYYPGVDVIVLRRGMTERRTVSTLAFELAHMYNGDPLCTPAVYRRAWRCDARLLACPADYARAEALHPGGGAIAERLGVAIVRAY